MLTSKSFVLAGCVVAVVGGTAFGWVMAGKAWQSKLPQAMVNSYTTTVRPTAIEKPLIPVAVTAPAPKVEEPTPAKAPDASAPPAEKKAEPKTRTDGKKRKAAAADPSETPRKARPRATEVDRGAVESFAKRYGVDMGGITLD